MEKKASETEISCCIDDIREILLTKLRWVYCCFQEWCCLGGGKVSETLGKWDEKMKCSIWRFGVFRWSGVPSDLGESN